jgi:hypothetical protein
MQSRLGLDKLTRQQKIFLVALAVFNLLVFTLAVLVLADMPPPAPVEPNGPDNSAQCEEDAAFSLRQHGVAASITITDSTMLVNVIAPDAAAAWDVFSATIKLANAGCGPYNLIRVDVPDPDRRPNTRLILELTGPEIQVWADGKLSDGQLSERTRRTLYQTAPIPTPTLTH